MGKLNPCRLQFGQMQFILEVFIHHIDHAVANSPKQKERAHQHEREHQVFPIIGYEKAFLGLVHKLVVRRLQRANDGLCMRRIV